MYAYNTHCIWPSYVRIQHMLEPAYQQKNRLKGNIKVFRMIRATLTVVLLIWTSAVYGEEREYVGEWAVQIEGGENVARRVARDTSFEFDKQIGSLDDIYRFRRVGHARSTRAAVELHDQLLAHERVLWAEQQHVRYHERREVQKRGPLLVSPDATGDDFRLSFNDPLYKKQWYLFNDGQNGGTSGMDMNVMPVWKLGYTGRGVRVTIVDDGVDGTHPDLKENFDIDASYDLNNSSKNSQDKDPHPDDSIKKGDENAHGTRCAGEVAAVANNSICGVGIAYEASIGGIRILDGTVTDSLEADALLYNHHYIDIYSCCWGPPDKGKDFAKPHTLTEAALIKGVDKGRNGKGSIFVWASGNGGSSDDDCNADGYVSRPETISIGSVNDEGLNVYFAEECSSTMAVTLSGGPSTSPYSKTSERAAYGLNLVATTDLHGKCTTSFVGTSSAAPLASGLFALVLQANPNLTWRDLQHIITQGCFIPSPMETGWHINGAGFHLNHMVGFGVLDAGKMVELALQWEPVGERRKCVIENQKLELAVEQGHNRTTRMQIRGCNHITKLEHTIANITFESPRRGDIAITLYSPYGTPSQLLSTRKYDDSPEGIQNWPFMTVHNWGEAPQGTWTLQISYEETPPDTGERPTVLPRHKNIAAITMWGFTFYGTGKGESGGMSSEVEGGARIFEDEAGMGDIATIFHVYNSEQRSDEEIHVNLEDVADGANLPPNLKHNIKDNEIDTHYFDRNAPVQTRELLIDLLEYKRIRGELKEFLRGLELDTLQNLYEVVERDLEENERDAYERRMDTEMDLSSSADQKREKSLNHKKKSTSKDENLLQRRKISKQRATVLRELLREVESRK